MTKFLEIRKNYISKPMNDLSWASKHANPSIINKKKFNRGTKKKAISQSSSPLFIFFLIFFNLYLFVEI